MAKYLITGGCGFLGANIASNILAKGDGLVVFDNLSRNGSLNNLQWLKSLGEFNFIQGDIRNQEEIEQTIKQERPDVIFHLAGQVAMTTSITNPRLDFEINILGSLNLLEGVKKYSPYSTIVYSSTNKVYGDLEYLTYTECSKRYRCSEFPNGLNESLSLEFHSPYGCSKGAADQYMLDYHRIFGLKTVVFRHSSMYGGRQFSTYDQGWIGWFCQKAVEKEKRICSEPFTVSGNGKQVRDVLYSTDMIELYLSAASSIEKAQGEVFNVGGSIENSLSLLELFDILETELNVKLDYRHTLPRKSDQKFFVADISKACQFFNWKPKVNKYNGVRKMLEWVTTNA